jgi:hypothetical protein
MNAQRRKAAYEAERRRVWRVLVLRLKAKLEVAYDDAELFRREFLADTVLPDGRTVGDWAAPQVEEAYRIGRMPLSLPPAAPQLMEAGGA